MSRTANVDSNNTVRRLSFHKRPYSKAHSRRSSQMSVINNYPPQQIDALERDEEHAKIYSKYKGILNTSNLQSVNNALNGDNNCDYDERIRVPRMSSVSSFLISTAATTTTVTTPRGSAGGLKSRGSDTKSSSNGLESLKEDEDLSDYKPASYDLTKGLRNMNYLTPPKILNKEFQLNKSRKNSLSKSATSISPSRIIEAEKIVPLKQINEPIKLVENYIPPILRPIVTNEEGKGHIVNGREDVTDAGNSHNNNNNNNNNNSSSTVSTLYSIDKNNNEPSHSHWKQDYRSFECADCQEKFSIFKRKHHCRHCGDIFCFRCLNFRANLNILAQFERPDLNKGIFIKSSKVCNVCYEKYIEFLKNGEEYEGCNRNSKVVKKEGRTDSVQSIDNSLIPSDWDWSSF